AALSLLPRGQTAHSQPPVPRSLLVPSVRLLARDFIHTYLRTCFHADFLANIVMRVNLFIFVWFSHFYCISIYGHAVIIVVFDTGDIWIGCLASTSACITLTCITNNLILNRLFTQMISSNQSG